MLVAPLYSLQPLTLLALTDIAFEPQLVPWHKCRCSVCKRKQGLPLGMVRIYTCQPHTTTFQVTEHGALASTKYIITVHTCTCTYTAPSFLPPQSPHPLVESSCSSPYFPPRPYSLHFFLLLLCVPPGSAHPSIFNSAGRLNALSACRMSVCLATNSSHLPYWPTLPSPLTCLSPSLPWAHFYSLGPFVLRLSEWVQVPLSTSLPGQSSGDDRFHVKYRQAVR
jgi:hypothetical protein